MIGPEDVIVGGDEEDWTEEESPDYDLSNADWLRNGKDLAMTGAEQLREFLAASGMTVEHFKTLPIYKNPRNRPAWFDEL